MKQTIKVNWEMWVAVATIIGFMWTIHRDNREDAQRADARWEALTKRWHIHDKKLEELTYKNYPK